MWKVAVPWNWIWRPMASPPLTAFTCQNLHTLNPRPRCRSFKLFCRPSFSAVAQPSPPLSGDLDRYLRCSMPQNSPLRVAVLVSGGVDSSVALRLLHAAGHSCTAFYLKIWFQEDFENFWSECPWEEDLKYAKDVCNQVDVPLEVVHLTDEYWNNVVSYLIEEYSSGRTPNPDVLCNTRIKFGAFLDAIGGMGFDYVASGHYANVIHPCADWMDEPSVLELSQDMVKDQTYFLSHLSQSQLRRLLFPLGCIPKKGFPRNMLFGQVNLLPDILGREKVSSWKLRQEISLANIGDFGFKNNVVFVSRNYFSFDKRRRVFCVGSFKWLSGLPPGQTSQLQCKVRHGPGFYDCSLQMEVEGDGQCRSAVVCISEDDQGLAAGQFAAFYEGRTCIGSGVILEFWDDQSFPVCTKALEIARMEDKSKIGNPVKIKVKPDNPQVCDSAELASKTS
ncbi:tRNA-specific 2-thiouridylase MnmA [Glycine max]|nr:tRNA-specific 2-thiouridylase MnmA [Glycine max]